jgi:hypothetical protein
MAKAIISPKKMIQDMVAGKTLDEAIDAQNVTTTTTTEGASNMNYDAFKILEGKPVLFHTVTYAFAGRLAAVQGTTVVIEDATWVADVGRIGTSVKTCEFNEAEHMGKTLIINAQAIVYMTELPEMPKFKKGK